MIPLRLGEIRSARLVQGNRERAISGVVADSRLAVPGSLFVCLPGSRADGHDFVHDAARRGAAAVLCAPGRGRRTGQLAALESAEPLATLAEIGRLVRARSHARVVGVAGSAGKTTLKDVLRALLAPHLPTVASRASHNNELGVPLTLALLEPETAACVCELGTGAPGELAALCATARPDVGVVTAIGPEHLEFFGSVEHVAAEEAALLATLPAAAPAVIPVGEPLLEPYRRSDLDEWRFGLEPEADVYPLAWRPHAIGSEIALAVRGQRVEFPTNLRLRHHRLSLAAAAAVYAALGLPLERIGEGAETIALSPWRGEEQRLRRGTLLINDAYNANPLSVRAALEAAAARRNGSRAIAVLGPMAELGAESPRWHALAGRQAAELGIDLLVAVGPSARGYLDGATGRTACLWFPDLDASITPLRSLLRRDDVVLLKGSRTAGLERLAEALAR
ncbi:MAG TPA: UDP-N-acetylmuramoyl-tripeptide--D-alanyl-D-alanine ligase [Gaiellaceae bacterium]|jgi:UDP-N-acetylmuramoyl-tripeptide--D-alanyl-D-alanine ligase|nr:UDP-N-acetylmuramoyl-tripeptide--D-alanyl-D-alanine ligase [Gaiellaceae bacterium]